MKNPMGRRQFAVSLLSVATIITAMTTGCVTAGRIALRAHPIYGNRLDIPRPDYTENGRAWTNVAGTGTNAILVLHLDATNHYSQGLHQGRLLAPQIKRAYETVLEGVKGFIPDEARRILGERAAAAAVKDFLKPAWKIIEGHVPQADLDEMQGLADGLASQGVSRIWGEKIIDIVHWVHAIPDLSETSCSSLVAFGSSTSDNSSWQMRLLDYGFPDLQGFPMITVYHPANDVENTVVAAGWVGFVGLVTGFGIDRKNDLVSISEMGYGKKPGEHLDGVPMSHLLKLALRYAHSADEAASIVRSARRNANAYVYLFGDSRSNAIGMIVTPRECLEFRANQCAEVAHGKVRLPQYPDVIYAGHYNEKQSVAVKEMHGLLGLEKIQEMARQIRMKSNLHIMIVCLSGEHKGDMWLANRHGKIPAADCEYVHFPAGEWIKK